MSLVAGCAVSPEPITPAKREKRADGDLKLIRSAAFTPTGPITLPEAIARAIVANLKVRAKQIEREIGEAELEKSNYAMLPSLEIAGNEQLSNVQINRSNDRIAQTANATLAWNVLDLGVSYARAHQTADQVLIARERERKAFQDIIRQVRVAFLRAVNAERLIRRVSGVAKEIQVALRASHELEHKQYQDAVAAAAYRRELVDSVRQILFIKRELYEAKTELAELLNLRQGTGLTLAVPDEMANAPGLPMTVAEMETEALERRPELRIEDYNERISVWQAREALYGMLPGLNLSVARNYSSETTNLAPNWISTSFRLGMNLFSLFSGNSAIKAAEKRGELARQQRLSLSLAVLTQVHMALVKYRSTAQQLRLAHEVARADRRLALLVRGEKHYIDTDYLEAVRLAAHQLESEMDEHRAYVDLISAHSDLMHAIGLDAVPAKINLGNFSGLVDSVRRIAAAWDTPYAQTARPMETPIDQLVSGLIGDFARPFAEKETAPPAKEHVRRTGDTVGQDDQPDDIAASLDSLAPTAGPSRPPSTKGRVTHVTRRPGHLVPAFLLY